MFWKKKTAIPQVPQGGSPFFVAWRSEDSGMIVNIDPGQIESPSTAGLMLADIYRHLARTLAQSGKSLSEDHARAEMFAMFIAELQDPTDEGLGTSKRN